jgi:hypothetical protein
MSNPDPLVPIDDVAAHFGVSLATVRSWLREKRIPHDTYVKIGKTYRFKIGLMEAALLAAEGNKVFDDIRDDLSEPVEAPKQFNLDFGDEYENEEEGELY